MLGFKHGADYSTAAKSGHGAWRRFIACEAAAPLWQQAQAAIIYNRLLVTSPLDVALMSRKGAALRGNENPTGEGR